MKTNDEPGLRDSVISSLSLLNQSDLIRSSAFNTFRSTAREIQPSGTLLIVDADPAVRQPEAEILCHDGYRVLQAQSFALLAKPFALNELLDKVRMLLDAPSLVRVRKPWTHD